MSALFICCLRPKPVNQYSAHQLERRKTPLHRQAALVNAQRCDCRRPRPTGRRRCDVGISSLRMKYLLALAAAVVAVAVYAESIESKRTRVMDTSTSWLVVTYYVVGKPLVMTRSAPDKPMTHDLCALVAQRMNEAAQISETEPHAKPTILNRCEPAELVVREK